MFGDALDAEYMEQCRAALKNEQSKSLAETNHWAHVDRDAVHADWDVLYRELSNVIDASNPSDAMVQGLIARHYAIACRFFMPSLEAYVGMALYYAENPDMKAFHNAYHPGMVDFLGEAICAYARQQGQ